MLCFLCTIQQRLVCLRTATRSYSFVRKSYSVSDVTEGSCPSEYPAATPQYNFDPRTGTVMGSSSDLSLWSEIHPFAAPLYLFEVCCDCEARPSLLRSKSDPLISVKKNPPGTHKRTASHNEAKGKFNFQKKYMESKAKKEICCANTQMREVVRAIPMSIHSSFSSECGREVRTRTISTAEERRKEIRRRAESRHQHNSEHQSDSDEDLGIYEPPRMSPKKGHTCERCEQRFRSGSSYELSSSPEIHKRKSLFQGTVLFDNTDEFRASTVDAERASGSSGAEQIDRDLSDADNRPSAHASVIQSLSPSREAFIVGECGSLPPEVMLPPNEEMDRKNHTRLYGDDRSAEGSKKNGTNLSCGMQLHLKRISGGSAECIEPIDGDVMRENISYEHEMELLIGPHSERVTERSDSGISEKRARSADRTESLTFFGKRIWSEQPPPKAMNAECTQLSSSIDKSGSFSSLSSQNPHRSCKSSLDEMSASSQSGKGNGNEQNNDGIKLDECRTRVVDRQQQGRKRSEHSGSPTYLETSVCDNNFYETENSSCSEDAGSSKNGAKTILEEHFICNRQGRHYVNSGGQRLVEDPSEPGFCELNDNKQEALRDSSRSLQLSKARWFSVIYPPKHNVHSVSFFPSEISNKRCASKATKRSYGFGEDDHTEFNQSPTISAAKPTGNSRSSIKNLYGLLINSTGFAHEEHVLQVTFIDGCPSSIEMHEPMAKGNESTATEHSEFIKDANEKGAHNTTLRPAYGLSQFQYDAANFNSLYKSLIRARKNEIGEKYGRSRGSIPQTGTGTKYPLLEKSFNKMRSKSADFSRKSVSWGDQDQIRKRTTHLEPHGTSVNPTQFRRRMNKLTGLFSSSTGEIQSSSSKASMQTVMRYAAARLYKDLKMLVIERERTEAALENANEKSLLRGLSTRSHHYQQKFVQKLLENKVDLDIRIDVIWKKLNQKEAARSLTRAQSEWLFSVPNSAQLTSTCRKKNFLYPR